MTDSYVIDASVAIQRFIVDNHTAETKILFSQLGRGVELFAPEFCILECTNILWKRVRFHGLSLTFAQHHVKNLKALPLHIMPVSDFLSRALEIGITHSLAIYDSIYLAMCEKTGLPLITVDAKQASAAGVSGIPVKPISDFKPSTPSP